MSKLLSDERTCQERAEKIFDEVLNAVHAGVYRRMGKTDIFADLGEPYGMARVDTLIFAQMLAENDELYARFKAKIPETADNR